MDSSPNVMLSKLGRPIVHSHMTLGPMNAKSEPYRKHFFPNITRMRLCDTTMYSPLFTHSRLRIPI